jgi:hypothetical protein
LAKETEFKGKKLRDLDVGPVIDFVREVLDYKSGMTPFTEPVQNLMTLEVKDAIIASIGLTHKWALYDRADYDKLEVEEALEVLRLCVKPTSLSNFFEKLEKTLDSCCSTHPRSIRSTWRCLETSTKTT